MASNEMLTLSELKDFVSRVGSLVERLKDHDALVTQNRYILETLAALVGQFSPTPRSAGAATAVSFPTRLGRKPVRPSAQIESVAKVVHDMLGKTPHGMQVGAIIAAAGGNGYRVKRAIAILREANQIRMTGTRSNARYFIVK